MVFTSQEACMDNFLPSEVVPCNATDRSAIYELDPDGSAYANIYELRKVKTHMRCVQLLTPVVELNSQL